MTQSVSEYPATMFDSALMVRFGIVWSESVSFPEYALTQPDALNEQVLMAPQSSLSGFVMILAEVVNGRVLSPELASSYSNVYVVN